MADLLERLKAALADRYAIERELGSGGIATVYIPHDVKHDRKVAIKVLRPELARDAFSKLSRSGLLGLPVCANTYHHDAYNDFPPGLTLS